MNAGQLNKQLDTLEKKYTGQFAVAVQRLDADDSFVRGEDTVLPTASTFKLFVLCELFKQVADGKLALDQPVTPTPDMWSRGDGVIRAMPTFPTLTAHQMAILMMTLSDNVATIAMTHLVGADNVTQTMRQWGLNDTNIFAGRSNNPADNQPVSSARDLCSLMTRIYRHEVLSGSDCDEVIRIMRAQRCNDMLPRFLPVGEDWGDAEQWIANKTGYGPCRVEVGVVHTHEMTYALAMFFKPDGVNEWSHKCLADYPPVLAMAHGCRAVHDAICSVNLQQ